MDYKTKKEELQKQFNDNQSQINGHQQAIQKLTEECLRLQGEHRLILNLENENNKPKTESKDTEPVAEVKGE